MRALLMLMILLPLVSLANDAVVDELLVRPVRQAVRPELGIDLVERTIADGSWETPREGVPDADGILWSQVTADADGWFRDDALVGAYALATIQVETDSVWLLEAMGYAGVYVNGALRIGNVYGYKDDWEPWEPHFDFSTVPVPLHAGENELLFFGVRWGRMRAVLRPAESELLLNPRDVTLPDLVVGEKAHTHGAIPVLNATADYVDNARMAVRIDGGKTVAIDLPLLAPFSVRKVGFPIQASAGEHSQPVSLQLEVARGGQTQDATVLELAVKDAADNRRVTFVSEIDGSIQYYGYLAAAAGPDPKALVLSLHGASVEALNQSGSYAPLSWGHIVAPTNRRPYGFDWENWGRLDALEVLALGQETLNIDPDRVYLTGHSMGGHGSWHLSTLYPDRFAAVGPSAGWITYWSYRREPPQDRPSPLRDMLARATSTSRIPERVENLAAMGVYVLHGADDDNVPPEQSHFMVEQLAGFHRDFVYHEQPDVGHWWDLTDEPGADCVAWAPMFDFFTRHRRPARDEVREIRFQTPSPAVSAWYHWAGILQQQRAFITSAVDLRLDPWRGRVTGSTGNVSVLGLDFGHVGTDSLRVDIDGDVVELAMPESGRLYLERQDRWQPIDAPDRGQKGPARNGGFRNAFGRQVQLVVGTQGTPAENAWALAKARHDAEYLWYQGNGSVAIVPDTRFNPASNMDGNVVLYGNADTNARWNMLWDWSIQVTRDRLVIDGKVLTGDDLGILAIQRRPGGYEGSVGIVGGTGLAGCRLTERRPYLKGGVAYPDLTVLEDRGDGTVVRGAGFFGNDWSVSGGEFVWDDDD